MFDFDPMNKPPHKGRTMQQVALDLVRCGVTDDEIEAHLGWVSQCRYGTPIYAIGIIASAIEYQSSFNHRNGKDV